MRGKEMKRKKGVKVCNTALCVRNGTSSPPVISEAMVWCVSVKLIQSFGPLSVDSHICSSTVAPKPRNPTQKDS